MAVAPVTSDAQDRGRESRFVNRKKGQKRLPPITSFPSLEESLSYRHSTLFISTLSKMTRQRQGVEDHLPNSSLSEVSVGKDDGTEETAPVSPVRASEPDVVPFSPSKRPESFRSILKTTKKALMAPLSSGMNRFKTKMQKPSMKQLRQMELMEDSSESSVDISLDNSSSSDDNDDMGKEAEAVQFNEKSKSGSAQSPHNSATALHHSFSPQAPQSNNEPETGRRILQRSKSSLMVAQDNKEKSSSRSMWRSTLKKHRLAREKNRARSASPKRATESADGTKNNNHNTLVAVAIPQYSISNGRSRSCDGRVQASANCDIPSFLQERTVGENDQSHPAASPPPPKRRIRRTKQQTKQQPSPKPSSVRKSLSPSRPRGNIRSNAKSLSPSRTKGNLHDHSRVRSRSRGRTDSGGDNKTDSRDRKGRSTSRSRGDTARKSSQSRERSVRSVSQSRSRTVRSTSRSRDKETKSSTKKEDRATRVRSASRSRGASRSKSPKSNSSSSSNLRSAHLRPKTTPSTTLRRSKSLEPSSSSQNNSSNESNTKKGPDKVRDFGASMSALVDLLSPKPPQKKKLSSSLNMLQGLPEASPMRQVRKQPRKTTTTRSVGSASTDEASRGSAQTSATKKEKHHHQHRYTHHRHRTNRMESDKAERKGETDSPGNDSNDSNTIRTRHLSSESSKEQQSHSSTLTKRTSLKEGGRVGPPRRTKSRSELMAAIHSMGVHERPKGRRERKESQ